MTIIEMIQNNSIYPLIFFILMGLSVLLYVILDGYDLGVGILSYFANENEQDIMISSIGPFWDANETWLVLGIGLLLVAFPLAHGMILTSLYIPVFIMLIGIIMRGCAFDFRLKSSPEYKKFWTKVFFMGSLITSLSQGFMLGWWILGLNNDIFSYIFSFIVSIYVVFGYCLLGSTWLIMKTSDTLQLKSIYWAKKSLIITFLGVSTISLVTPLFSNRIFDLWFSKPQIYFIWIIPFITFIFFIFNYLSINKTLKKLQENLEYKLWKPFLFSIFIFILSFFGIAYSSFPFLVLDKLTIWQAASSDESLKIILIGAIFVLPFIFAYTILSYYIFHGKSKKLEY